MPFHPMERLKHFAARGLRLAETWTGYRLAVTRRDPSTPPPGVDDADALLLAKVRPFTMTGPERLMALIDGVRYVVDNGIPGSLVECGVWRGGSVMAALLTLLARGDCERDVYLFDTFSGMTEPTDDDRTDTGESASDLLRRERRRPGSGLWCWATRDDVTENIRSTGYPPERVHFVEGDVLETLPAAAPPRIALLRLDTDWYESTAHELEHLYPRLSDRGVLIIDDYGHWQGARRAVDEYFSKHGLRPLMHRIDYTGRCLLKPPPAEAR
jgi:hypothetical protein